MSRKKKTAAGSPSGEVRLYYPPGEIDGEGSPECWGLVAWSKYASCYMAYFFDCEGGKVAAIPIEDREQVEWVKANIARWSSEWHTFNKWHEERKRAVWEAGEAVAKAAARGRSQLAVDPDSF